MSANVLTPYDYFGTGLFYPDTIPVFTLPKPPLNISDHSFNLKNAWWLANLSHLAYHNEEQIKSALSATGFNLIKTIQVEQTFCYLARSQSLVILAFRGTQFKNKVDAKTDLNFPLTVYQKNTKVHRGFLNAIDLVWPLLEPLLKTLKNQSCQFWFTGHSLGAALATLAAARFNPQASYLFGSPRLVDKYFMQSHKSLNIYRIVNCCDLVCTLPPSTFGFTHIGNEHFICSHFDIYKNIKNSKILKLKWKASLEYTLMLPVFRKNHVWFRSLVDHSIINYNIALWNCIKKQNAY